MSGYIDDKDRRILGVLKNHGDYTTRQIAKKTLIPTTTINNRIRKLKKLKVIKNFTVNLDYSLLDRGFVAYIQIFANLLLLKEKRRSQYDIVKELRKFDFIERADIVSGGTDIIAIVRVKNVEEFDKVLMNKIQSIDGVDKTQSMIVIH